MPTPSIANALVNTLVTLHVDTGAGLSQSNIDQYVWFADTDGDVNNSNGNTVDSYVTNAKINGNITWVGAVLDIRNNPRTYVLITGVDINTITPNGGIRVTLEPTPSSNSNATHVNGKILGNTPAGLQFDYTIYFKVVKIDAAGNRSESDFSIDPKINVNP